jgi:alpha-1,3-glucosyltransferase
MRAAVIVSEYLVYIPAVVVFLRRYSRSQGVHAWEASIALVAILMQPSTILIDNGHFQFNTVMLGFAVASLSSLLAGRLLWGSMFFVAALGYKQMALYYAPAMFAYLLGTCLTPQIRPFRLVAIAVVTLISFALILAPLLFGSLYDRYREIPLELPENALLTSLPFRPNTTSWSYTPVLQLTQSIHRIFPFSRGLFEDKVANLWCAVHTFYKLNKFSHEFLQRLSAYFTVVLILAPCMIIGAIPRKTLLPLTLASTAWGFFLCSFQVHEKSVLLPLLPMTLLLGGEGGLSKETRAWVGWANMLGAWTLFPLLKRDLLRVPYFVITLLWAYLLGLPPTSLSLYFDENQPYHLALHWFPTLMQLGFYAVMVMWHVLEAFVPPPNGKPDIWVVVNVLIGAAGFTICYAWCTWNLVVQSGLLEEYFRSLEKRRQEEQQHPEAREQAEIQMQRKSKSSGKAKAG